MLFLRSFVLKSNNKFICVWFVVLYAYFLISFMDYFLFVSPFHNHFFFFFFILIKETHFKFLWTKFYVVSTAIFYFGCYFRYESWILHGILRKILQRNKNKILCLVSFVYTCFIFSICSLFQNCILKIHSV